MKVARGCTEHIKNEFRGLDIIETFYITAWQFAGLHTPPTPPASDPFLTWSLIQTLLTAVYSQIDHY